VRSEPTSPALAGTRRRRTDPTATLSDGEDEDLVRAAAAGDAEAWNELVRRYAGLIWAICRSCSLRESDAADVSQVVWLRLIENLSRLREPERLKSWLAVVTRNECIRVSRRAGREIVTDVTETAHAAMDPAMERGLVTAERHVALCEAFDVLSPRCRALIRVLAADPRPSYDEVSELLSMPIGSIGPTRQRCLDCLRRELDRRDVGENE
jgi:RNA polymerase sigma factor (sigma-70 family)